jgi:hypothetical protein
VCHHPGTIGRTDMGQTRYTYSQPAAEVVRRQVVSR